MKRRDNLKQELLKDYARFEPVAIWEYGLLTGVKDYEAAQGDLNGDGFTVSVTHELMAEGVPVRVFIEAGTREEVVLRLLRKLKQGIKHFGFDDEREGWAHKEKQLDEELCPRCGAGMQATHHPLCQYRDGTLTELTDEEVRKAIAVLGAGKGPVNEEEIPF